jgi:hypothetical protein
MSRSRIKGGEKNVNSGKRWSKDELLEVLKLYINNPDLKIHESNIVLQELADKLCRTTRSVEAQLLMFRNLDKFGLYGYKNMNRLCRILWKQYIDHQIYNSQ